MGAEYWQVRNSATLCFTALVVRVLGLKNTHKWEAGKKAVSGKWMGGKGKRGRGGRGAGGGVLWGSGAG